jgi:hemolysin activation/secretion protein
VQAATPMPDAGQTARELQQDQIKHPEQKTTKTPLKIDGESEVNVLDELKDETLIAISGVRITGNKVFQTSVLQSLVTDLTVGTHTLADLEEGAERIRNYYKQRGYFLANAYIPAQDIKDGVLNIAVLEGALDKVKLNNSARVSDEKILGYLASVINGDASQRSVIDRQLLLLRSTIGVDRVHASLQGGSKVGTSDLLVATTPAQAYSGNVQVDNFGNRYTGEYRVGASININSPLQQGDQLSARIVGSSNALLYARLAYQLPLGGDGWRVGAAYSHSKYQLGKEFDALGANGTTEAASLFTSYPLYLSQISTLFGTLTYDAKKFNDNLDSVFSKTEKRVQSLSIGLSGDHLDKIYGGGRTSIDTAFYAGHLRLDETSQQIDVASAKSSGDFVKASYFLNRLQRLADQDTLSVSLSGQLAGNNLNSSEKYSLGGSYGVRAYPQGEASGDAGSMLNVELTHNFMPQLQGVLFYDYGHIKINHNNFSTADNTRTIAGAGVGVNASLHGLRLNSYLAWRTQGGVPMSEPVSVDRTPRLWVQVSGEF